MTLINTDGMAFIGPGSEWFWTALTGVVLGITFIGIWRQLRLERAADAVVRLEALWAQWRTDEAEHAKLSVAHQMRHGKERPLLERYTIAAPVLDFLDSVAELREGGLVSLDEVWWEQSLELQNWIAVLSPLVDEMRSTYGFGHYAHLGDLAAELLAEDRRRGVRGLMPAQDWLDAVIVMSTTRLTQRRLAREGMLPGA